MSNLAKGKKVQIKATGEYGIIKDIERVKRETGNREDVTYLVKLSGKPGWIQCERKALSLVADSPKNDNIYPKEVHRVFKLPNGSTCTLVGVVGIADSDDIDLGLVQFKSFKMKYFNIGYSICHADDVFDEETGLKIATKRCYNRPMAEYLSPYLGEFRDDMVDTVLDLKQKYILDNYDAFVNKKR